MFHFTRVRKRTDMPKTNILFWVKSTSKLREGCYFIFITFWLDLQDGSHLVLHVIHVLFHLYKMLTWIENNLFCIAWSVNYLNYIIFGLWYVRCRQIILNPIKLSRCIRLQLKIKNKGKKTGASLNKEKWLKTKVIKIVYNLVTCHCSWYMLQSILDVLCIAWKLFDSQRDM